MADEGALAARLLEEQVAARDERALHVAASAIRGERDDRNSRADYLSSCERGCCCVCASGNLERRIWYNLSFSLTAVLLYYRCESE